MNYNTEVKILAVTPDCDELTEYAGRLCYNSTDKTGQSESWLQTRIKQGHGSLIEHASATFYIKASRVFTHEIVRHRLASYSQRSQRYVKESEPNYIIPTEIQNDISASSAYKHAMNVAWDTYKTLLDVGFKPEIARYVLPNACMTEIICTWNFREIRHIINLRTSPAALPEMQEVANKIKVIMHGISPKIFGDL